MRLFRILLIILAIILGAFSLSCAARQGHLTLAPQSAIDVLNGRLIVHEWVADNNEICFEAHAIQYPLDPFPTDCISLRDVRAFAKSRGARVAD